VILIIHADWMRDTNTFRLTRSSSLPKLDPVMDPTTSVQPRFYPIRTSLSSCIRFPEASSNNFELKLQFINAILKFHGLEFEDAYFFTREFEKVCFMMRILQLGDDTIRLYFIPLSLKDLPKKWLYSLAINSIISWDDFVKIFLKKFYPIHKILSRKNIIYFK